MNGTISLKGLEFFAYHGCKEIEKKVGSNFIINLSLEFNIGKAVITDNLEDTVDYISVYHIIASVMKIKSNLLEHLAYNIVSAIFLRFKKIKKIHIDIAKNDPPIGGKCKNTEIHFAFTYDDFQKFQNK